MEARDRDIVRRVGPGAHHREDGLTIERNHTIFDALNSYGADYDRKRENQRRMTGTEIIGLLPGEGFFQSVNSNIVVLLPFFILTFNPDVNRDPYLAGNPSEATTTS
jgi:hypothetical protein